MPPATTARAGALALALAVAATACGGSSSDPATVGPRRQAEERLRDYGLTAKQATCVVDELGAESVVEVGDLDALVASQQYKDAARTCITDG
ncbi:MAG: hypothetical protein U0P45_14915 [Acidimicrobiales bacterium]